MIGPQLIRWLAIVIAAGVVIAVLFVSGRVCISPDQPGFGRHRTIDWGCPRCDNWGVAYVSTFWGNRARRRAIGLAHARLSPHCPCRAHDLLIVSLN
jgi:hypothetical protein